MLSVSATELRTGNPVGLLTAEIECAAQLGGGRSEMDWKCEVAVCRLGEGMA